MFQAISLLIALYAFWLLLSGFFTPPFLVFGALCAIFVLFIAKRMDVVDREGQPFHLIPHALLLYWPWLAKEIMLSAWDVTKRVLHPRLPISPTLVEFTPTQKTDLGLVIHANSITLTPGTISVEVEPGRFLVHALTREGAAGLAGSEMDRRCSGLEQS